MKYYEYINETLKEYGCRKAFGVPGKLVMPIWQNLKDIEIITCSHEQEASYVATAYSKATGELVAVITTGSPAVTNCATGIASANMDSVPMVYISGRTPVSKNGLGLRQEESNVNRTFNSVDFLDPLTKKDMEINDISNAAQRFSDACEIAISDRPGCVHLSIDMEVQLQDLPSTNVVTKKDKNKKVDIPEIPKITKPLIILGWGCWQAKAIDKAYELAEKIGAPVLVTAKGSPCIWEEHPCYLGKLGYAYNPVLEEFLIDYSPEQVLVFGSSMSRRDVPESCLNIFKRAEICLYSVENKDVTFRVSNGHWIEVDDIQMMLESWNKDVKLTDPKCNIKDFRQKQSQYYLDNIDDKDLMSRAILELNNLCDDSCVITADAGNHLEDAAILYEPKKPGGMFLDQGTRTMGSGICSSVGMAFGWKDKFFVAVTGDGTMLMNGNIMYLAKRYDLPIVFLVINNSSHGRVRIGQMAQKHFVGTDLGNIDFELYGKTFGLETYKATSIEEFRESMQKIMKKRKTSLLELITDKDEIPISLKGNKLF